MAKLVVEIHVPLVEADVPEGDYAYPWIEQVEAFIDMLEEEGALEYFDDGEESGDVYVFFITGSQGEQALLQAANRVAALEGVPPGVVAYVSSDEADEWGQGRRVPLTVSA